MHFCFLWLDELVVRSRFIERDTDLLKLMKKYKEFEVETLKQDTNAEKQQEFHDSFLSSLINYEHSLIRTELIQKTNFKEMEGEEERKKEIGKYTVNSICSVFQQISTLLILISLVDSNSTENQISSTKDSITTLKSQLSHAQLIRQQKEEYEILLKQINQYPSREESTA